MYHMKVNNNLYTYIVQWVCNVFCRCTHYNLLSRFLVNHRCQGTIRRNNSPNMVVFKHILSFRLLNKIEKIVIIVFPRLNSEPVRWLLAPEATAVTLGVHQQMDTPPNLLE